MKRFIDNKSINGNIQVIKQTSNSNNDDSKAVTAVKAKFLRRVSDGVSILVERHGYSQNRARSLILSEIRGDDPLPSDNEIFDLMEKLNLGIDEAKMVLIVSKAYTNIQNNKNLETVPAIEYLTSCLSTMKLLGKMESQSAPDEYSSSSSSISIGSTTSESVIESNTALSSFSKSSSKNLSNIAAADNNVQLTSISSAPTRKSSIQKNSKPPRMAKPEKRRKRSKDDDNKNNSKSSSSSAEEKETDVDAKVAEKVILQKSGVAGQSPGGNDSSLSSSRMKSPSPNVTRAKRVNSELDSGTGQQPTKRQRLDSI